MQGLQSKVAHMLPLEKLLSAKVGPNGVALMRGMLQYEPAKRFTATQCLQQPFFSQYASVQVRAVLTT